MLKEKKLTSKELKILKKVQLDILDDFVKICDKHNLRYVLSFGTCIGAVRHNGYIPWDDDIDVAMPRSDYDKFIELQKKELDPKKYYFQSFETDGLMMSFAKIRRKDSCFYEKTTTLTEDKSGIWIDIFPYDYTSDNSFVRKLRFIRLSYLTLLREAKYRDIYTTSFVKKVISLFIKFMSHIYSESSINKKIYKIYHKSKNTSTLTTWSCSGSIKKIEYVPSNYFDERILHDFEDRKYYISKYYDYHLKSLYGDYMKLPPKEKQRSDHFCVKFSYPKEYNK